MEYCRKRGNFEVKNGGWNILQWEFGNRDAYKAQSKNCSNIREKKLDDIQKSKQMERKILEYYSW